MMDKKKDATTEEKILEAAERLFLDRGFARTSTTDIAREVGCNHALVHYYFRTKENLFQKIFENKIGMLVGALLTPDNPGESFQENLRRKIAAHFDILAKNPKLPMLVLTDIVGHEERLAVAKNTASPLARNLFAELDRKLETEIQKGTIRQVTGYNLVMNILSLNVFTFASMPLLSQVLDIQEGEMQDLVEARKRDIIETILKSLRP